MDATSLQLCLALCDRGLQLDKCLCPWDSLGKNTGVGCHALLQGIFQTQGSNPNLTMFPALAGGFFTASATREAPLVANPKVKVSPLNNLPSEFALGT